MALPIAVQWVELQCVGHTAEQPREGLSMVVLIMVVATWWCAGLIMVLVLLQRAWRLARLPGRRLSAIATTHLIVIRRIIRHHPGRLVRGDKTPDLKRMLNLIHGSIWSNGFRRAACQGQGRYSS